MGHLKILNDAFTAKKHPHLVQDIVGANKCSHLLQTASLLDFSVSATFSNMQIFIKR
jgi:hypothetical protein